MNGCMSLIMIALEWSEVGLGLALYAGLCAGLLAIIVLAINVFFRRWLSAGQMGFLWSLVLLRLLIPVAPSAPFSLQNLLPSSSTATTSPDDYAPARAAVLEQAYAQPLAASEAAWEPAASNPSASDSQAMDVASAVDAFVAMLPAVWLIGIVVCVVWTIFTHWQFCRQLQRFTPWEDQRERELWEACCKQVGVRRSIPIVVSDVLQQPAIAGLFRPQLLLPASAAELDDQQLRMVMLHELAHVRRWDVAVNCGLVLIRALHWWNPVYWLAAARFHNLREQSCDAFAVQRIEGTPTREYRELLLALVQRPQSNTTWRILLPASMLGFVSSYMRKRAIQNRLQALRSAGTKRSSWHTIGVASLFVLLAAVGLTDASTPQPSTEPASVPFRLDGYNWNGRVSPPIDPGPIVTRTYDVQRAMDRISIDEPAPDVVRMVLISVVHQIVRMSSGGNPMISDELARERVSLDGATLTVSAPVELHAEIVRNLQAWEQNGLCQTSVEIRFVLSERDIASAVGIAWQYLEAFSAGQDELFAVPAMSHMPVVRANSAVEDYLPIAVATLNQQQASRLIQTSQGNSRANIIQAPKVTLFNGQQASVFDCSRRPFVVGFEENGTGDHQPKIAVIDEGTKVTLRTTRSSDAKKTQLEARIALSNIDEVRTASTLLRGKPATIQIPRVNRSRIDVSAAVQDGETLLIGCLPTHRQKGYSYVLLTVRHIELED